MCACCGACSEGMRLANKRGCKFIEVSAFLDHRVDELLAGVVAQVRLRQLARPNVGAEAGTEIPFKRLPVGGRLRRLIGTLWSRWTGRCFTKCKGDACNVASCNCDNLFLP